MKNLMNITDLSVVEIDELIAVENGIASGAKGCPYLSNRGPKFAA